MALVKQPDAVETFDSENPETETENPTLEQEVAPIVKHPLQNAWTLWYFQNDKSKKWEDNQREVITFNTVEDFWCLYNHIKPAGEFKSSSDYSVFKEGIRPMWEDENNKNGGRWLISLDKPKYNSEDVNMCWLELILCMIGEAFDENSDEICGAVVSARPKCAKIGLWTADANNERVAMAIGHKLKECLPSNAPKNLLYQTHMDTVKHGSFIKTTYQI